MGRKVLVLNQDFRAVTVCNVQRAFLLVYLEKADLISEVPDHQLRSITATFPMPSIIRLRKYVNLPYRGVVLTRHNIFKRDGLKCQYCGSPDNLTLDHVIPKSRGGSSNWDNLITACKSCNSKKGDYIPEEISMVPFKRPFKPSFIMFLRDFSGNLQTDWMPYLEMKKQA
ncbi:MAG TPA: HNH endonuclease [Cytophagales bacterium]|nr:HNH endonuclease [Cytophagales bacterium]